VFGKRFVLRADKKLTAFVELESANSRLRRVCLTSRRDFRAFTVRAPMSGRPQSFWKISAALPSRPLFHTILFDSGCGLHRCGEAGAWGSVLIHRHRTRLVSV
jgi:hypothetical protein